LCRPIITATLFKRKSIRIIQKILDCALFRLSKPNVNIEHTLAENDFVLVFLNFNGTHSGQFEGMPPTNKPVKIRSADLYRIENGKIVGHWDVADRLDLLKQTGAINFNGNDTNVKL
jgi:predicted SnoaL-like aldol condensation-catalyzing enzyme